MPTMELRLHRACTPLSMFFRAMQCSRSRGGVPYRYREPVNGEFFFSSPPPQSSSKLTAPWKRHEWTTNSTADNWYLYGPGAPGGTNGGKTLAAWMTDATFGATLRGAIIGGTGFNLGTGGGGTRAWIDWSEISLVNGGARVDF